MAGIPDREGGGAEPWRGLIDGISRRTRAGARDLRDRADGLGASVEEVREQVADRVGSAVQAVKDATRTYHGLSWSDAQAASRPLLTIADLERVRATIPTGECLIASPFGHGWPGQLRVLVHDGRTVGYVHRLRRPIRSTVGHRIAVGIDVALDVMVLMTSPMTAFMYPGGGSNDDSWYDAVLHDATGRVLLWTRPVDPEDTTAIEVMLPDGTAIARVRRDPPQGRRRWGRQHGSARVTGVGPLAGTELTSATPAVWWNAAVGGPDAPTTWVDRDGAVVVRVFRRAPEFHLDVAAGPATLLAACGALWWWTHRESTG